MKITDFQLKSGNASYPSKAATYNLRNSKAGTLSVRRIFEASPPLQGHIDIEFFGNKKTGKLLNQLNNNYTLRYFQSNF